MEFQRDERVERRRARRRQVRRRRAAAVAVLGGVVAIVALSTTSLVGPGKKRTDAGATPQAPQLPRGGTSILPEFRVVAFFGYPRSGDRLGVLGVGTPTQVAERLSDQALDYDQEGRHALPAFELIATLAHNFPTEDGKYRSRLPDSVIQDYLAAARQERAIVILDIQPGYADFMDEARHYEKWLEQPDVSLALDPEWSVRPGEVLNREVGSTTASKINQVSAYLADIVKRNRLPDKLLLVHQFTSGMIKHQEQLVPRDGVELVLNVDGFAAAQGKIAKYNDLTADPNRPTFALNGFKLFYEEDTRHGNALMSPFDVLDLDPQPDVIVYE